MRYLPLERETKVKDMAASLFAEHVITKRDTGRWLLKHPKRGAYWCEIVAMAHGGLCVWGDLDLVMFAYCTHSDPVEVVHWMGRHGDSMDYVAEKAATGSSRPRHEFDSDTACEDLKERLREYVTYKGKYHNKGLFAELLADPETTYDEDGNPKDPEETDAQFLVRCFESCKIALEDVDRLTRVCTHSSSDNAYFRIRDEIDYLIGSLFKADKHPDIQCFYDAIAAADYGDSQDKILDPLFDHADVAEFIADTRIGMQIPMRVYYAQAAVARLSHLLTQEGLNTVPGSAIIKDEVNQ